MADEIEKQEEVAEIEAEETEMETDAEESETTEEPSNNNQDKEAELQALLEAERERGRQEGAAAIAYKQRKKKREEDGEDDEDEGFDDKPLTASRLQEILAKERQETRNELMSERIASEARRLATSETEAQLIMQIHKNRQFPSSMSVEEQVREAFAIRNMPKVLAQNEELKRGIKSREMAAKFSGGTQRDGLSATKPKIPAADLQAITAAGFKFDARANAFKKTLSSGMVLWKSRDLKKDWQTNS